MTHGIHGSIKSSFKAYSDNTLHDPSCFDKAYGASSKKLGGADPSLAQWYEEALPYWQAVQSGQIQISQQEYQQLASWMQWAQMQLQIGSSSWGDLGYDFGMESPGGQEPMSNGNGTYTDAENEFTVDGSAPVSDVWGDAILNVPPPCIATFETTTDNRFTPPETVVKAVITNPSMKGPDGQAAQSVVYIHDGGKITCNGSKKSDGTSRISDSTGTVTVGEYHAKSEDSKPQSSLKGVKDEATGEITYESENWEDWIEFFPQAGENEVHVVFGNANISTKPSDKTDIICNIDGSITVTVTHANQSTDVFKIQNGATVNINGNPINITVSGKKPEEGISEEFVSRVQINGKTSAESEGAGEVPKEAIEKYGEQGANKIQIYLDILGVKYSDLSESLRAELAYGSTKPSKELLNHLTFYDSQLKHHKAAGDSKKVTERLGEILRALGYDVETCVEFSENQADDSYGADDNIKINGIEYELDWDKNSMSIQLSKPGQSSSAIDNSRSENQDKADAIKRQDIIDNVPMPTNEDPSLWNHNESLDLAMKIGDALQGGNWDQVNIYFSENVNMNGGCKNNIIRKIITALFKASGSDKDVFMALLKKIPQEVRQTMIDWVESPATMGSGFDSYLVSELTEQGTGDEWNSAGTAAIIKESME